MEIKIQVNTKPALIEKDMFVNRKYEGFGGVYVMRDVKDVPLYVGKTSNFRNRMVGHRRDSDFYREIEYIELYHSYNEYKKDILETYLINELRPIHNIAKTYYLQDDYQLMLSDVDEEISELVSEIEYIEYYLYTPLNEQYPDSHVPEMCEQLDDYDYPLFQYERKEEVEELAEMKRRLDRLYVRKRDISMRKSL